MRLKQFEQNKLKKKCRESLEYLEELVERQEHIEGYLDDAASAVTSSFFIISELRNFFKQTLKDFEEKPKLAEGNHEI